MRQGSGDSGARPTGKTLLRVAVLLLLFLAGYVAVHIYRWGQPVPQAFHAAGQNRWRSTEGRELEAQDQEGDGTYDRYAWSRGFFQRPTAATPGNRLLILCLDGVPYSTMRELWDEGHFGEFFPPVELVSTFPSETEVALTALFHAPPAPGYENEYFDRRLGKVAGGIRVTLAQSTPYLKKLDYDEPAMFKGIHFVLPRKSYRADLGRLRRSFLASPAPVFVAHISSTDALHHVLPRDDVRALLREAEALLRDLYFGAEGRLRLLLFSDHGSDLLPGRPAPIREALQRAGFRVQSKLDEPRAVAIPEFGLVSFAAVYAQSAVVSELARVLAQAEGVEAVVYLDEKLLWVQSRDGAAVIEADATGARFLYRAERGDPLRLLPVWDELRKAGKLDASGFAREEELFAATIRGPFPDALFRIWEWAREAPHNYVENRADLLVTLADGYYLGRGGFQKIVRLQSTHGGLGRRSSLGFAMSTDARFPRAVRYNELLTPPQGKGGASPAPTLPVFLLPR